MSITQDMDVLKVSTRASIMSIICATVSPKVISVLPLPPKQLKKAKCDIISTSTTRLYCKYSLAVVIFVTLLATTLQAVATESSIQTNATTSTTLNPTTTAAVARNSIEIAANSSNENEHNSESAINLEDDVENEPPKVGLVQDLARGVASDSVEALLKHLKPRSKSDVVGGGSSAAATDDDGDADLDNNNNEEEVKANIKEASNKDQEGGPRAAAVTSLNSEKANKDDVKPALVAAKGEVDEALDTYGKWRGAADELIELFSRKLLPELMQSAYEVDGETVAGIAQVYNGVRLLKPWALKLLDASAKITSGILLGSQSDFGDFDECLAVRYDAPPLQPSSDDATAAPIQHDIDPLTGLPTSTLVGRYCLADIEFPKPPRRKSSSPTVAADQWFKFGDPVELRKPLYNFSQSAAFKDTIFVETGNFLHMLYVDPIRVGICLTNKINPSSVEQVFNKMFAEFKITVSFKNRCVTKYDRVELTSYQRTSAIAVLVACCLVVISTMLDLFRHKAHKLPVTVAPKWLAQWLDTNKALLTSFSLLRNTQRLFKQHQKNQLTHPSSSTINNLDLVNRKSSASSSSSSSSSANLTIPPTTTTSTTTLDASSTSSSPSTERRGSIASDDAVRAQSDASLLSAVDAKRLEAFLTLGADTKQQHHLRSRTTLHKQINPTQTEQQTRHQIDLSCLHGVRVITMSWMIVNHTYLFGGFFVLWAHRRLIDIAEWPKSLSFQLVLNGWLTVETYFFLSATIIVLNVLPLMASKKFSYAPYVFHRLVRLLPAYLGLIALNFLSPLVSNGPVWLVKGQSFIKTPCEEYLWSNILFVNNWLWPEKMCMVHTWFLSADFQLYLAAPLVVVLLSRKPNFGHAINALLAIAASAISGFVIYANKLLPSTLINKLEFDSIKQQLSYSYFATYQHLGPYCLGLFVGYTLYKRPFIRLPKHLTISLWLLLPPLSFTTLLLTYLWNGAFDDERLLNPSPLISAIYVAIHRIIWTSLLAWLVFAASTGRAKLLNSFLGHSAFVPLSRLSFSIYLSHLPVIMFRALNLRHTVEWTDANIIWEACGNFVASVFVAYFLNVAFESPMINLERVLLRGCRRASFSPQLNVGGHKQTTLDMRDPNQFEAKLQQAARLEHQQESRTESQTAESSPSVGRLTTVASRPATSGDNTIEDAPTIFSTASVTAAASIRAQQYATLARTNNPNNQHLNLIQRRPLRFGTAPKRLPRYNTLTSGDGALVVLRDWRAPMYPTLAPMVPPKTPLPAWLEATPPQAVYGRLIPRVDCSTLGRRRHSIREVRDDAHGDTSNMLA